MNTRRGTSSPSVPTVQGDPSRRVKVLLPGSLQELQSHASRHFGSGASKLLHHGKKHLALPHQIGHLQGGDVIVVTKDDLLDMDKDRGLTTTHQDHYVQHPLPARAPATQPLTRPGTPSRFEGATCYETDYVEYPVGISPSAPCREARGTPRNNKGARTGKSMYSTQYPWHNSPPAKPLRRKDFKMTGPFDGRTSYTSDYTWHPEYTNAALLTSRDTGPPHHQSQKFDGVTTYYNDFRTPEMPAPFRRARARPKTPIPFEGSSEYTREFVQMEDPRLYVYLEPELYTSGRRSQSQPMRSRTR